MPNLAVRPPRKCLICDSTAPHRFRLEAPQDTACTHAVEVCSVCWEEWIASQLKSKAPSQLSCAHCDTVLGQEEVRAYASKELYERYLDLSLKSSLSTIPEFHHCIDPTCNAGAILETCGTFLMCETCHLEQCTSCAIPWHWRRTCAEIQLQFDLAQMDLSDQAAKEVASEMTKQVTTKECPGCKARIEKSEGCDYVMCNCGTHFCYECGWDYLLLSRKDDHGEVEVCEHHFEDDDEEPYIEEDEEVVEEGPGDQVVGHLPEEQPWDLTMDNDGMWMQALRNHQDTLRAQQREAESGNQIVVGLAEQEGTL